MKRMLLLATLVAAWPGLCLAQTMDEIVQAKNTDNVTTASMGLDRKSYSPLKQINKTNIKRLVPIWNASLMNDSGELSAPVV
jgi:alcohol dehydrogenase (cytochrome c)